MPNSPDSAGSDLKLDGANLSLDALCVAARSSRPKITLCKNGLAKVEQAHAVVIDAIDRKIPVYGLTTGLGSRVNEALDADSIRQFSLQTLRGRAHAMGKPLPIETVRAAMIVRLNTLLKGAAGASPQLVSFLGQCIDAGVVPVVGETGSIGASDLCLGATMGLALTGEGRMTDPDGLEGDAAKVLDDVGLQPLALEPKDGLALANHSSFSAAMMALAIDRASTVVDACQSATALSMAGFEANLSPLSPLASTMRPQAGQRDAADCILELLQGEAIIDVSNARRLQDPLSLRNVAQTHGAALAMIGHAMAAATDEINGASDNPVVDVVSQQIVSCGAYHTPLLTIMAQAVSQALVHVAHTQLARISRMLSNRFTGLPQYLAAPDASGGSISNGFAPVLKVAESLVARLSHAAAPVPVWPSVNAEGIEDAQTNAITAIQALDAVADNLAGLCAIELLVARQAVLLRGQTARGPSIAELMNTIAGLSEPITDDRPLGQDIERVSAAINRGKFAPSRFGKAYS